MSQRPKMIRALKPFWKKRSRYKVLYGGRASGKSYGAALHLILMTSHIKLKVLCIRQFQNNIRESVYTLLKDIIYDLELQDDFEILSHTIRHKTTGSEFIFYGIARNWMEIKSTEGVDVCYIEEAHSLTKEQFDVIDPTIRKEDSEIFIIFNPQNRSDYVWQHFVENERQDGVVKKINYDENPYLSRTMQKIIEAAKEEDYDEYEHIYLGKPREGDDRALFAFDEIVAAMNNSIKGMEGVDRTGVFSYAADVARYGNDKSCTTKRRGYHIYDLAIYKHYSAMELANAISDMWHKEQDKKPAAIFIDTIGIGSGVYDRVEEKGLRAIEANVAMKADQIDTYQNKRAEMYFRLRDFIRKGGKIPNDEELKEELLSIRYMYSKTNGKIQLEAKDDMKEKLGRSPDKADSVALHFFSEVAIESNSIIDMQRNKFKQNSFRRRR